MSHTEALKQRVGPVLQLVDDLLEPVFEGLIVEEVEPDEAVLAEDVSRAEAGVEGVRDGTGGAGYYYV
jgi:hypothetical protein